MTRKIYELLQGYMLRSMSDSAHDQEHVYRVLYNALKIAGAENDVDYDVLIAACLLHDVGRREQLENPSVCHAEEGSRKACEFLLENGFSSSFANKVAECILTHRFRRNDPPKSLEAKILFDADKLDVTGAMGIARTLVYRGTVSEPLYLVLPDGGISTGENDPVHTFFREYKFKLEGLYDRFYTETGRRMAASRQKAAQDFYKSLYEEASGAYESGHVCLESLLEENG